MLFRGSLDVEGVGQRAALIASVLILGVLALGLSYVVGINETLALYATAGIAIFLFAFLNTDFALTVLILSMLLSPEFSLGGAGGVGQMSHRSVIIRIDDVILGLVTASWLIKTSVDKELGLFMRTPLNKPMFAYLGISLLATLIGIFAGNVRPMLGILYVVKYFQYFLIFFMVANQVRDLKSLERFLKIIFFTAFLVSVYAIAQIPSGVRVSAPFEGEAGEANTLGGYLVFIMGLLMGLMTASRSFPNFLWKFFLLGLMGLPFAYTLSRSSWIAMGPTLLVLAILSPARKYVISLLLVLAVLLPIVTPNAVYERIGYTFSETNQLRQDVVTVGDTALDPSVSARLISWVETLEQWTERPFFGWGITGAGFKDAQYFRVLVEGGIFGFAAFIWLIVAIHLMGARRLREIPAKLYPRYHGLVVGYLAGYWGLLTHAVGANTFIIVRIMEPFWFVSGLVFLLPSLIERAKEEEPGVLKKYAR